jgi:glycosyltransferase involved in cell wall biosynthesis
VTRSHPGAPVRVLWLIKGLGPGGAEHLLVSAAKHVDRERFEYEACYLLPWKDHLAADLERGGVPARCLDVRRGWNPQWVRRLRHLIRERRYGVVHAHLPYAGIGARLAVRRLDGKRPAVVYTEHNTWERYRPATRRLNAATFRRNDAVIAVSRTVAESMRVPGRAGPPVTVIPNGIDVEGLRRRALSREEARAQLGLDPGDLAVGTVGGLTAKKGHAGLVRAARLVVERCPRARFVFVGLPVDPEPIRREVGRMGLADHILLTGYRPAAGRLMRAFDVYCLPSRHEGMPVSLLEAMALGIAPVATAVGGTPEVVTDREDGMLVPAGDEAALAEAVLLLAEDTDRRRAMGRRAAATAERFGLEAMVRRTEQVYLEALATRA